MSAEREALEKCRALLDGMLLDPPAEPFLTTIGELRNEVRAALDNCPHLIRTRVIGGLWCDACGEDLRTDMRAYKCLMCSSDSHSTQDCPARRV